MSTLENLLPIAILLWKSTAGASAPAPARPASGLKPRGTGRTLANEVPRVRTGEDDPKAWAWRRYQEILAALGEINLAQSANYKEIALSLLAQWAHESNRGKNEFNHNFGGWKAWKGDPFFTARDVQSGPASAVVRWSAWSDFPRAVRAQIERLYHTFPTAWAMLLADPWTSSWVEELGRRGYYAPAGVRTYAAAWARHRAELAELLK